MKIELDFIRNWNKRR